MVVDEPLASLDPAHQIEGMELLRSEADMGGLVIAVLHDLTLAARFCDSLVLLRDGVLVAQGSAAAVLSAEHLADAYRVTALHGEHEDQRYVLPWRQQTADRDEPG